MKDSGERESFDSGMVRDTTAGKIDFTLALDGPMFERYAAHLTKGAEKYEKRNWMKARGQAELDRFRESALRHFLQWLRGDQDEDHAAAVIFNINGAEYVEERMGEDYSVENDSTAATIICGAPGYTECAPCDMCVARGECYYFER